MSGGPGPVRPELGSVDSDLALPRGRVETMLGVVINEPPPAFGGMLVITDSRMEAVVTGIPEPEDAMVNATLPAGAEDPPYIMLQYAVAIDELVF